MAYSKQTWDTNSYVNPTRMNHIEQGIYDASTATGTEYSSGVSVKDKIDSILEWKNAGTYDLDNGVGNWTVSSLADSKEILIEILVATPGQVRYSILIPYDFFTSRGAFVDYTMGNTRVYCNLSFTNDTTIAVSTVSNTTGSKIQLRIYNR